MPGWEETHSGHGLKAKMMTLQGFDLVIFCITPVPIHNKCDVLRYGTLLECADEKIVGLLEDPFCRR